jgi:hypothetical protein
LQAASGQELTQEDARWPSELLGRTWQPVRRQWRASVLGHGRLVRHVFLRLDKGGCTPCVKSRRACVRPGGVLVSNMYQGCREIKKWLHGESHFVSLLVSVVACSVCFWAMQQCSILSRLCCAAAARRARRVAMASYRCQCHKGARRKRNHEMGCFLIKGANCIKTAGGG